ncbi:MAG TPA: cytochrome c oxidase subunit II, partial [Roseiflexaceae bacterium]|nr:cytochrome c oxidase subunit II [Roseiflexaceae bacterium]
SSPLMGIQLPGAEGRIDPRQVETTPPFNDPGVHQVAPNQYEVVMRAEAFLFTPREIRVPAGADITFTVTSKDVIHGFYIEGTRVNLMIIPGQIARTSYRFEKPGEYTLLCHEFCGAGHHVMFGKVIVE